MVLFVDVVGGVLTAMTADLNARLRVRSTTGETDIYMYR